MPIIPVPPTVPVKIETAPVQVIPGFSLNSGRVNVTTTGTRVQMSPNSSLLVTVTVKAKHNNTGKILIGNNTVDATSGFELWANEEITLSLLDINLIWLDCSVNGEGVSFIYVSQLAGQ